MTTIFSYYIIYTISNKISWYRRWGVVSYRSLLFFLFFFSPSFSSKYIRISYKGLNNELNHFHQRSGKVLMNFGVDFCAERNLVHHPANTSATSSSYCITSKCSSTLWDLRWYLRARCLTGTSPSTAQGLPARIQAPVLLLGIWWKVGLA